METGIQVKIDIPEEFRDLLLAVQGVGEVVKISDTGIEACIYGDDAFDAGRHVQELQHELNTMVRDSISIKRLSGEKVRE